MREDQVCDELLGMWDMLKPKRRQTLVTGRLSMSVGGRPVLAAVDRKGAHHLLLPTAREADRRGIWRSAAVALSVINLRGEDGAEATWLDIQCRRDGLDAVFVRLVASVLASVEGRRPDDVIAPTMATLEEWKELLGRGGDDEVAVTGLLAELLILERLAAIGGGERAFACWGAPECGRHDFRFGRHALEVKGTLRRNGRVVSIHGAEQLLAPDGGDLHLVVVHLERVPGGPHSIGILLDRLARVGIAREGLLEAIADRGIDDPAAGTAAATFDLRDTVWYEVDGDLPRIIPTSFTSGGLPAGVLGISYDIDLTGRPGLPGALVESRMARMLGALP